jgi:hypothetical protein
MATPKALVDFADRVGSTFVQAFAGVLGAAEITGLGDLKSALIAAVGAALIAVVKVIGAQAASFTSNAPAVQASTDDVVKLIAAKLKP